MKTVQVRIGLALAGLLGSGAVQAQQWEVGALAGSGLYLNNSVSGPRGSGSVGFNPGYSVGGWIGHNNLGSFGGEVRYLMQSNEMKVTGGGTQAVFGGRSHLLHYDVVIHTRSHEDRFRPFIAIGGGFKGYIGTGTERAFQPLSNLAVLSKTTEWRPLLSVGAGVKWMIAPRLQLRAEVRDYITPFPRQVILPGLDSKISGWVHDVTPLIGISYIF